MTFDLLADGSDTMFGGDGRDVIQAFRGVLTAWGNNGNDTIRGDDADDPGR